MIVIAAGGAGLDLSVGFTATLTAILTAGIMDGKNGNLPLAILAAIIIGAVIGFANGTLVAYVKAPAAGRHDGDGEHHTGRNQRIYRGKEYHGQARA